MIVEIDEDEALELLMARLDKWTEDKEVRDLFKKYFELLIECEIVESEPLDVKTFVDDAYETDTTIISEGDEHFEKLLELFKQGDYECLCGCGLYIEVANDEDNPTCFLCSH